MADETSEARSVFFTDLNELQAKYHADEDLETAWQKATAKGFAFQSWVDEEGPIYCMAHYGGHLLTVRPSPDVYHSASQVLAGLLGLPSSLGIEGPSDAQASPAATPPVSPAPAPASAPSAPAAPEPEPEPALAPNPAAPAPPPAPPAPPAAPEPDPQADPSTSTAPLDADQRATIVAMLRELPSIQSQAAIVSFRKAFKISPTITKPSDAITEVRHLHFLQRIVNEAEGIAVP